MILTIAILLVTVAFFIHGKVRSDLIAICALLCLMSFGILTPAEAFAGFANPIIFTIAAMFIISGAITRSGLAALVSSSVLKLAGTNQNVLYFLTMLITALIGALVSNTGTVAIMLPIVGSMALAMNASQSRFLMPLAFMSGMGGMLTLIGNPPNMVVNDVYVKAGFESLTLFSFLPIGIICMIFGMFILTPVTSYLLARRSAKKGETGAGKGFLANLADKYSILQNAYKLRATSALPSLKELNLTNAFGVTVQEIVRKKKRGGFSSIDHIVPTANTVIMPSDEVSVMGTLANVTLMAEKYGLSVEESDSNAYHFDSIGICELVIMSASRLVNATVAESGFREKYGVTVLGIQRGGEYILDNLKDQQLHSGDALLMQGKWESINRLDNESAHWVVVGKPMQYATETNTKKIPIVLGVLVAMIAVMATGVIPTVLAALLAAVLVIITGCFKNMRETYSYINWETLIMVSCLLPLATAMEKTGVVGIVGEHMSSIGFAYGPLVALAVIYIVTSLLNIIISFTPLTLLIAPIAMHIALALGCDPLPFMFAVAAAAGLCFGSSFSTPSNALVVSAGRYTFMDYLVIGLPLQLLLGVVLIIAIPMIFPF
ncbi:MAG: SLC13 family permease [Deferribacteraceae bacterium]|jgi:di/tricarboxylate transporter|nr:SLC13 family permease [Deferribacteraceae bacterium]